MSSFRTFTFPQKNSQQVTEVTHKTHSLTTHNLTYLSYVLVLRYVKLLANCNLLAYFFPRIQVAGREGNASNILVEFISE